MAARAVCLLRVSEEKAARSAIQFCAVADDKIFVICSRGEFGAESGWRIGVPHGKILTDTKGHAATVVVAAKGGDFGHSC